MRPTKQTPKLLSLVVVVEGEASRIAAARIERSANPATESGETLVLFERNTVTLARAGEVVASMILRRQSGAVLARFLCLAEFAVSIAPVMRVRIKREIVARLREPTARTSLSSLSWLHGEVIPGIRQGNSNTSEGGT